MRKASELSRVSVLSEFRYALSGLGDSDLARSWRRNGEILANLKAIETAMRGDGECAHLFSVMLFVVGYI